jgi:hypothetical protein
VEIDKILKSRLEEINKEIETSTNGLESINLFKEKCYIEECLQLKEYKKSKAPFRVMVITKNDEQYEEIRETLKTIKEFALIHPNTQFKLSSDVMDIYTDEFCVTVIHKSFSARGFKAHKIIDLTDDKEFHNVIALPMLIRYRR